MRRPFLAAFLAALALHVLGLTILSLSWEAWRQASLAPALPELISITPLPVPPDPEPLILPEPIADTAPETMPITPALSAPLAPSAPPEPPPVAPVPPRSKPVKAAPVTRTRPPRAVPVRTRRPRPTPPETALQETPAAGAPDEPLGRAGRGSPAPSPVPATTPGPGAGQDVGALAEQGGLPAAAGAEGRGRGGTGAGGEGEGPGAGSARTGTGSGSGGGAGAGRGGAGGTVGGTVGGTTSARPLGGYQVKPRYPESARRRGIEGTTRLKMRITEQGRVEDVQVEHSAGHQDLDRAAIAAVRRWRFEPARHGGAPVAVWVVLPVEFTLR